jgi:hypothetical protein
MLGGFLASRIRYEKASPGSNARNGDELSFSFHRVACIVQKGRGVKFFEIGSTIGQKIIW